MNRYDDAYTPQWKLNTSHLSATSYSFAGYRNDSTYSQPIRLNYSQCESPALAEYLGTLLEPIPGLSRDDINVTSYPAVSGRFDNSSASLEITGIFEGYSAKGKEGSTSYIGGPITISFLGRIDGNRSDELLSSSNATPVWHATLGYSKTLFQSAGWRNKIGVWVYILGAFGLAVWFL
jgi:hypothetical protein